MQFGKSRPADTVAVETPTPDTEHFDASESAALLMTPTAQRAIGKEEIRRAAEILKTYKAGKSNFEKRIIEEEEWWKLRHNEVARREKKNVDNPQPEPNSAWTFNSVTNKHADWMDNVPDCSALPREASDQEDAKVLSEILSVIDERTDYEQVWSDTGWYMLKHGVAAQGTFWDPEMENGLGDMKTVKVDMLNLFWEPGICELQESRNVFITKLAPNETLEAQYPQLKGKLGGTGTITVADYLYDDSVDNTDKSVVVDWYYKKRAANGRVLLHYCKFVGDEVLFASENESEYTERGWYDHGKYPVTLTILYPEEGTVTGFGIIAVCRDPQKYIDKMGGYVLKHAMISANPRYWASTGSGVNRKTFLDWNEPIIEVEGVVSDEKLQPVQVPDMDAEVRYFYQMKIDELKETSSNRDVNQGSSSSGITAAAAISALQEAGNKGSRDFLTGGYRSYREIKYLQIELARQFYSEAREFRITNRQPGGVADGYNFVSFSNAGMQEQQIGVDSAGLPLYRRPVYDIKVKAQKRNPYSKMQQMEYAKEFYAAGMFNPDNAQAAMIALKMMDFEGRDEVLEEVQQGQTLMNICQQLQQQNAQMQQMIAALTGAATKSGGDQGTKESGKKSSSGSGSTAGKAVDSGVGNSMTDYGMRLAEQARPDLSQAAGVGIGDRNMG